MNKLTKSKPRRLKEEKKMADLVPVEAESANRFLLASSNKTKPLFRTSVGANFGGSGDLIAMAADAHFSVPLPLSRQMIPFPLWK